MNKLQKTLLRLAPLAVLAMPLATKASTSQETVDYIEVKLNDLLGILIGTSMTFVSQHWLVLIFLTFTLILIGGFWRKIRAWVSGLFRR